MPKGDPEHQRGGVGSGRCRGAGRRRLPSAGGFWGLGRRAGGPPPLPGSAGGSARPTPLTQVPGDSPGRRHLPGLVFYISSSTSMPIACTPDVSIREGAGRPGARPPGTRCGRERRKDGDDRWVSKVFIGTSAFRFPLIAPISPTMTLLDFLGDHFGELGQIDTLLLLGEGRGGFRVELRGDDDVAEIEAGQHETG